MPDVPTEVCLHCKQRIPSTHLSCPYCLRAVGSTKAVSVNPIVIQDVKSAKPQHICPHCGQTIPPTYISCPSCLRVVGSATTTVYPNAVPLDERRPEKPSICSHCGQTLRSNQTACPWCPQVVRSSPTKVSVIFASNPVSAEKDVLTCLFSVGTLAKGAFAIVWGVVLGAIFHYSIAAGVGALVGLSMGLSDSRMHFIYGGRKADKRQPYKHRWLTNGLRPRRMHWGPRRLF